MIVLIATMVLSIITVHRNKQGSLEANQAKYTLLAFSIFSIACYDFIPNYGFELYPIGFLPASIFVIIISYAIVKYNLMDIRIVIKKSIVYTLLVTILTLLYFEFITLTERLFQNALGYKSILTSLGFAAFIVVIFIPLREKIQSFLDKRFFEGTLESLSRDKQKLQQELFHKEKLAYVGQLASSVVHEIKNPLTSIKTFLDHLPNKYNDPEFREKFDRIIPKEIERIDKVVNDMLHLAKPAHLHLAQVDIPSLIEETLVLLENHLKANNITLHKHFDENLPSLQADSDKLQQAFLNLLLNSIQSMERGGTLTITAQTIPGTRTKGTCPRTFSITISDTGKGMTDEQLSKLFQPFQTSKKNGIGLGMVITQETIKEHGGTIAVKSVVGEGTVFRISLPISSGHRA